MTRILVVEDDKILQAIFKSLLIKAGYEADAASDGEEALSKAIAHEPDLIVLDMQMPNMDGIDFLRAYDVIDSHPRVKVIAFSNTQQSDKVKDALALGVLGYMTKSEYSPRAMIQLIRDTLARNER